MSIEKIEDRIYLKSSLLDNSDITHFFTTKAGGYSTGKIRGLNLGFRVGDEHEAVRKNYMQICRDFDIPFERIIAAKQTHSDFVRIVTEEESGFGVERLDKTFESDGLVTNCPNLPIVVFYADCVPILMFDQSAGVVAAVHSGWRGTVSKIAEKAVFVMQQKFGASPENIKAAIGPSIGKCCFETGKEVACNFEKDLVCDLNNGKFKVDLWEANKRIVLNSGLLEQNIDVLGICTMCHPHLLYSYRVDGDKTGRMGALIMIKNRKPKG